MFGDKGNEAESVQVKSCTERTGLMRTKESSRLCRTNTVGSTTLPRTDLTNLNTSIVLVTGAIRGVGRVYMEGLLARWASKIRAAGRDVRTLEGTVGLDPARVVPIRLDVTDPSQIAAATASAPDVPLLVNNAGSLTVRGAPDIGPEGLCRDVAVNNDGLREMT